MCNPNIHHNPPAGFAVREATYNDVEELTRLWFASFNSSHEFWKIMTPDNAITRQWLNDVWTIGIRAGPSAVKTFVVEELSQDKKLMAFLRLHVPQADGNQNIPLPDFPREWDAELTEALWVGMSKNRAEIMGDRPHWNWVCRQADAANLEVYADATIKGLPLFKKYFGFQERKLLTIPPRPNSFGTYEIMAGMRPARSAPATKITRAHSSRL
ncbi:hypothetical protein ABW20_dc0108665 [Dactylellina cionopaga]|nr:hypothetical protein ABW20_dc0108665 [Dactylellina cionopaga]